MPRSLLILLLLLAACGGATPTATSPAPVASPRITGSLMVFAASSLTDAFEAIKARLEAANPGTRITLNFGASSTLETQLEQGARADVFASADMARMDKAKQAGLLAGDSRIFIQNAPVIIVPATNPGAVAKPRDLARPGVKLVLAGKDVPIGHYARQIFQRMDASPDYGPDFSGKALANLVSEESNVRQVVTKIQLGEGDAGIVYASDVTPAVRGQLRVIPIPDTVNVVARYPAAVVKGTANEAAARAFLDYLVSDAGQTLLQSYGFIPLKGAGQASDITRADRREHEDGGTSGL